ncbi:MAG TPA: glycolate oxidase subunit GlcE [Steroidobacteraceae bacterium]|nr:glycolate oxidase subunit GlcE [Steroidobacteraceae bacterium]
MAEADLTSELVERVREAAAHGATLRVHGGDSKRFYGRQVEAEALDVSAHRGVLRYDPAELVVTARAGTRLDEITELLAASGQRLPFEPPQFTPSATLGGMVAAGLAGPARASAGAVRDHLLGVRILTGDGRVLRFGGEVIKNVAGYDVARIMAGSLGTLAVLLEVSLRVVPRPMGELSICLEASEEAALGRLTEWSRMPLPLTASCWFDGVLTLRLEGSPAALARMHRQLGGTALGDGAAFWRNLREQTHAFFDPERSLWRLSLPPGTPALASAGAALIEWNGMQRWCLGADRESCRRIAAEHGGFATAFRGAQGDAEVFEPLTAALGRLHASLKRVFDPQGVLNPGRMYRDF